MYKENQLLATPLMPFLFLYLWYTIFTRKQNLQAPGNLKLRMHLAGK